MNHVEYGRDGRPVVFKDNAVTRLSDRIANLNRMYGPRSAGGGIPPEEFEGLGVPVRVQEAPPDNILMQSGLDETGQGGVSYGGGISPEEAARREAAWAARTGQRVGSLATDPNSAESEPGYASEEEMTGVLTAPGPAPPRPQQAWGPPAPRPRVVLEPPDFTKLQGIDLEKQQVFVGGVPFAYGDEVAEALANIVVGVVETAVKRDLEAALARFKEMRSVPRASAAGSVLPPREAEGQAPERVLDVPEEPVVEQPGVQGPAEGVSEDESGGSAPLP